jgi:hypothetical protein
MKSRNFKINSQSLENMSTEFKSDSLIDLFGKSKITGGYAPLEDDENSTIFGKILINKPDYPDWKKIVIYY